MVIVIIILAGISINALIGDNGLILRTGNAKERAEIAGEKDIIEQSTIDAIEKDKFRELTYAKFTKYMNINSNDGVEVENVDGDFYVTFKESKRIYKVDKDGNIEYLGKYSELASKATITASPEEDTYPKTAQEIDITVTTIVKREEDEVVIHYGWSKDKNIEATNYIELEASIDTTQRKRTGKAIIEDEEGSYYLWVKVLIDNNVVTQKFGPYAIKSHTALVPTTSESSATAGFLGSNKFENSKEVTRDRINSVKITDTFTDENGVTHTINDSNCWDVSVAQDKKSILAWFEVAKDKNGNEVKNADNKTMYNITIAQEGGVTAAKNSSYLFYNVGQGGTGENVITGLEYLDTRETTKVQGMFEKCAAETLNLNKFDTSKVTNMYGMFDGCNKVTNLNLSNFDTSNVTTLKQMFRSCEQLIELNLNKFDTRKVTNMGELFRECKNLKILDVAEINTDNVTSMYMMFAGCSSLTSLNLENINTKSVTDMNGMFSGCKGLTNLDVTKFNTSNVSNMNSMFTNCSGLTSLDLKNFDTTKVDSMASMFYGCEKLNNVYISSFDTKKVASMSYMFRGCKSLVNLDLSNFDTVKVTNMSCMFYECQNLRTLNLSSFNTNNVKKMDYLFFACKSLSNLNLDNFNTSNVTNMKAMFQLCYSLTSLSLANFDTSNVTDMTSMFGGCSELVIIYVGDNWDISNVTESGGMFNACNKLVGDIPFNSSYTDKTYATKTGGYMTYKPST